MSWRIIVVTHRAKLEYKMGYLVVRKEETLRVHISEISTVVIEDTSISLTASLLCELAKHKIKVIFCDEKRNPCSELVNYYGAHDTSNKYREQLAWSNSLKALVWTEIVKDKIRQQKEHLELRNLWESEQLEEYLGEVVCNDATNREGHAAKVYFNALFGKEFTRASESPENFALNYGYTILLSAFNREIVSMGYFTQLGLFHDNMFNYFNLSSDLMEPYRILVDRTVASMNIERFDKEHKWKLIDILNQEIIIDNKRQLVNNGIKIYCKSVFDALNNEDIYGIRFYRNEL